MRACDGCLRRSALVGGLAHFIAIALRSHRRLPAVLSLGDRELIEAVCGPRAEVGERLLESFDPAAARREAKRAGLGTVCRHDSSYPPRLCDAVDAPAMLYVRGEPELLAPLAEAEAVALVGSRRPSPYGLEVAYALGRELAAAGVPIVSGMALGIDSAAHEGALAGAGLTVAVLGGGADLPYPPSAARLWERIVATGMVVSEMPPGTKPLRWSFPARNRIMAGLCRATVVVEGGPRSGSLITARFAEDLGREVGGVPGQVTSELATGPNDLLADGAFVVRSAGDVLDALYGAGARPPPPPAARLEERLADLLAAVERGQGTPDALASDPAAIPDVLAGLTELELMGLVRRGPGGGYVRCA
jgi:DNA processing protein